MYVVCPNCKTKHRIRKGIKEIKCTCGFIWRSKDTAFRLYEGEKIELLKACILWTIALVLSILMGTGFFLTAISLRWNIEVVDFWWFILPAIFLFWIVVSVRPIKVFFRSMIISFPIALLVILVFVIINLISYLIGDKNPEKKEVSVGQTTSYMPNAIDPVPAKPYVNSVEKQGAVKGYDTEKVFIRDISERKISDITKQGWEIKSTRRAYMETEYGESWGTEYTLQKPIYK